MAFVLHEVIVYDVIERGVDIIVLTNHGVFIFKNCSCPSYELMMHWEELLFETALDSKSILRKYNIHVTDIECYYKGF